MTALPILAVTTDLGHSHSVLDALPHLGGMLMVLATLAALWGLTAFLARLVALVPTKPAPPAAAATPTPRPATTPITDPSIPADIVAVIAAAVASSSGGANRRVISIKPTSSAWEKAGRQSVLSSHRIR